MKARALLGLSVVGLVVLVAAATAGAHGPTPLLRIPDRTPPSQSADIDGSGPVQSVRSARLQPDERRDGTKRDHKKDTGAPAPVPPPSTEPTTPPPSPPVVPDPAEQPAAPGTVVDVACASGDMMDHIEFQPPVVGGPVQGFRLLSAPSSDGQYSWIASATADALGFEVSLDATATAYYRVVAVGPGGDGPASEPVSNSHVSISAEVPPSGGTIRSSNGEMTLAFPAGSVAATSTVTIEEVEGTPTGGIISLAGVYDLSSSSPIVTPVRLSVAYTIGVTHFQVSAAMLSQACLMTFDASAGAWMPGATDVQLREGMLSGDLAHFSYWLGGVVQPHGTSTTAYCSDGGICHNLSAYPGTLTRLSGKDPQVCFNCHGSMDLTTGPAGASGENVQAAMQGAGSVSSHPVAIGDLACTSCHDPHASPTASPGLLRVTDVSGSFLEGGSGTAPGTEFCWACHGTQSNRRIAYLVPSYWQNVGGDKKTGFNGAHAATRTTATHLDSADELGRGLLASTEVTSDGLVVVASTPIELPKTQTPVPSPDISGDFANSPPRVKNTYDGDWSATKAFWSASAMGATAANGWVGSSSLTIDLGSPTEVRSFEAYFLQNFSCIPDVMEIQASDDGITWTPIVSQGTLGTRLPAFRITLEGTATCRYVRFAFQRRFTQGSDILVVTEMAIKGIPSQGTYVVRPDIARKAPFGGGTIKWQAAVSAPAALDVATRASLNNGTTWTAWAPVLNGGAITQIPLGTSLESAILEVRATLTRVGAQQTLLDWIDVTTSRGDIGGTVPEWSGPSPANQCQRCHVPHGSTQDGLVASNSMTACATCHTAAYGGSYAGSAVYGGSVHQSVQCASCHTAHGNAGGAKVSYPFLLNNSRREACLGCHATTSAAFDANQGDAAEWAKHDIYSSEQVKSGSRIACRNCHSTHASPTGLVNPDNIGSDFTAVMDDPTSIPIAEAVVYASKDALLESSAGKQTWNYGASTEFTITQANRALLYFDLSGIPAGSTIQNATLYLWKTSPGSAGYTGSYKVFPASRSWVEGTGAGVENSASVNGATWLEWQWGDNANTGNVAGGDWQTPGGDYSLSPTVTSSGLIAANITNVVQSLYSGANCGIVLTDGGSATSLPIYTRHNADLQYQPRLRIVYRTGPATRQVVDDITFCTKCHDGTMPLGLSGQTLSAVASSYAYGVHGGAKGLGPESDVFGYWGADQGGGGLKAPFSYGMDPLPCTTCHDPHGSRLPYHLREVINGSLTVEAPPYGFDWGYGNATQGDGLGYFCAACHVIPSSHSGYANSLSNCSTGCHSHAGR